MNKHFSVQVNDWREIQKWLSDYNIDKHLFRCDKRSNVVNVEFAEDNDALLFKMGWQDFIVSS